MDEMESNMATPDQLAARRMLRPKMAKRSAAPATPTPAPIPNPPPGIFHFVAPLATNPLGAAAAAEAAAAARDQMAMELLQARVEVAETEVARLLEFEVDARGAEKEWARERVELHDTNQTLTNTITDNMAQIAQRDTVIENLSKELSAAKSQIEVQERTYNALEQKCVELQAEAVAAKERATVAKAQAEAAKIQTNKNEEWITDLEARLKASDDRKEELDRLRLFHEDEIKRERLATETMKQSKEHVDRQLQNYINDTKKLTLPKLNADIDKKKKELAAKDNEIATLRSEALKAATSHDEALQGLREEINQLKADVTLRVNTHPEVFKSSKAPKINKPRDLQQELDVDSEYDDATTTSSSSSESEGEKKDAPPRKIERVEVPVMKEVIVEVIKEIKVPQIEIVEVPGPIRHRVQFRDRIVAHEHIVKNQSRLEAWFGAERDFVVLFVQSLVASIAYILGVKLARRIRSPTPYVNVPIDDESDHSEDAPPDYQADRVNMQIGISLGTKAAPDGPAPGTDPADPKLDDDGTKVSKTGVDLAKLFPPLDDAPDTRVPLDGVNDRINSNASTSTSTASITVPQEGFFDILGARRPPVRGTLFTMLLHMIVYYFIYVCVMTYFEREMWREANDTARISALELVRYRGTSLWYSLLGHAGEARLDRLVLVIVQLFGVDLKPFPTAG